MARPMNLPESPDKLIDRLWQKDTSLWQSPLAHGDDLKNRLGWLDAVEWMTAHVGPLSVWAQEVCSSGRYDRVILLGMGGSSLAAEVFAGVFSSQPGFLQLTVVDTTSPAQINSLDLNIDRTLFIVSSKSGTTRETMDLFACFYQKAASVDEHPGERFIAITDACSALAQQAEESGFCRVFLNPADIGGRYSALGFFGLVPAALIGVDLNLLLENLKGFCRQVKSGEHAAVTRLAGLMGDGMLAGVNRLQLNIAQPLQALGGWIEQLIAESTGKNGTGLIPIYGETHTDGTMPPPGGRRLTINIGFDCGSDHRLPAAADLSWSLSGPYDIASEFFRWQMATTLAAALVDINPFDQPDVEQAKKQTRRFVENKRPLEFRVLLENDYCIFYADDATASGLPCSRPADLFDRLQSGTPAEEYLAILAWLPAFDQVRDKLQRVRAQLSDQLDVPATLGFGPRYLHSTGQLHKGGPVGGCFIQIIDSGLECLPIPGREYGFGELHQAQADGDYSVLAGKARWLMRIALKGDRLGALDCLCQDLAVRPGSDLPT